MKPFRCLSVTFCYHIFKVWSQFGQESYVNGLATTCDRSLKPIANMFDNEQLRIHHAVMAETKPQGNDPWHNNTPLYIKNRGREA